MTTTTMRNVLLQALALLGLLLGAAGTSQAQTVVYYHTDALGSPVAVTDTGGMVLERREYEPYGKQLTPTLQNGPGYTGHVSDAATGLSYMQQRYYDPEIGRFLSVDPVAVDTITAWDFCRYCYAAGNPYAFIDPDGRQKTVAWLVRLTANGMQKVARLTREQAIRARGAEHEILADRRQISSGIERAAHGSDGQLKHAGHELKDGSKGLPHYQTQGKRGHSFWGQVSVAAASVAGALNQAADAAEYIPDAVPRPATQSDISRTNNIINTINDAIGTSLPNYPNRPHVELPPSSKPEEPKSDPNRTQ